MIYIKPNLFQQEDGFKSIVPVGKDTIAVTQKLNSEPLSSFSFLLSHLTLLQKKRNPLWNQ